MIPLPPYVKIILEGLKDGRTHIKNVSTHLFRFYELLAEKGIGGEHGIEIGAGCE